MPTIMRKTVKPISTLYFNMQSGSCRKLPSNLLSLKHRNTGDKCFRLFRSGALSVIRLVFLPEKILLKLKRWGMITRK